MIISVSFFFYTSGKFVFWAVSIPYKRATNRVCGSATDYYVMRELG
ncbi:unnamed protein product, partial [Ectocarpus sp. 6 AP-2014]